MIAAKRAAVRPRVLPEQGSYRFPVEDEVFTLKEARERGIIAIIGLRGSGKTTALEHLAALLPPDCHVVLLDEPNVSQLLEAHLQYLDSPVEAENLVIYTAQFPRPVHHLAVYGLAPWDEDDIIEYLLAEHRPRCAAVISRVRREDFLRLGGLAELWRIALDQLALNDSLPDVRSALHQHLAEYLTDTDLIERARSACLNVVVNAEVPLADALIGLARPGFAGHLIRMLSHRPMQRLLASERIAADLHGEANCDYLARRLPRELVEAAGHLLVEDSKALLHLQTMLAGPSWSHAMAVSLLHAAGKSAQLKENCPSQLAGAYLENVYWPGVRLENADLRECELSRAHLRGALLSGANLHTSVLHQSCLKMAILNEAILSEADIRQADLFRVSAYRTLFNHARVEQADLSESMLERSLFLGANLRQACFRHCDLTAAVFTEAEWEGADFTLANLTRADLSGLRLSTACWDGVCFRKAELVKCDLEYMTLRAAQFEQANLRGALLTGSTMPGGNFRGACLHNAGLADIEWEGADLRRADLRGASFHMGSTRSGLVGSTIPCEGSKTGFYTDDYEEQSYKAPEDIRKANLCGADLRGAILDNVDFYLVDLRGAQFDEKYENHLRRCGAILETRT